MKVSAVRGLLAASLLVFVTGADAAEPGFLPIEITAKPIKEFMIGRPDTRFGRLEFRGGLELTSKSREFGSLSGLDSLADETIYAVADTGFWFTAKPIEESGRLVGLVDAQIAPILDQTGRPVMGKRHSDAEGLRFATRDGHDVAFVSFEQTNDLRRFVPSPDLAHARPQPEKLPKAIHALSGNQGLEAIAIAPPTSRLAGATVLVAEHFLDKAGNNRGWIVGGPLAGSFTIKRVGAFDVTDAAFLPDGDLLILERGFNFTQGLSMRIRRIVAAEIEPGAVVDGESLIEADMRFQIDNMEGLAVSRGGNGETLITIVSDNNQSLLQRTLLLQFALFPESAVSTAGSAS